MPGFNRNDLELKLFNFRYQDVRSLISDEYSLNIDSNISDPSTFAWQGGKELANSQDFSDLIVSKKIYEEVGHNACKKKFDITQ